MRKPPGRFPQVLLALVALSLTTWATSTMAADDATTVTHHTGVFNGKTVRYTAAVESMNVVNAAGQPAATVVSFAYWKEATAGGAKNKLT